jgi:hypothetical protein
MGRRYLYISEFLICLLCSVAGGVLVAGLSWYILGLGDRYDIFGGIFIGMPVGCILGLVISKKYLQREESSLSFIGIILGLIVTLIEIVLCLLLVDLFGNYMFLILPIIMSISFLWINKSFKKKGK